MAPSTGFHRRAPRGTKYGPSEKREIHAHRLSSFSFPNGFKPGRKWRTRLASARRRQQLRRRRDPAGTAGPTPHGRLSVAIPRRGRDARQSVGADIRHGLGPGALFVGAAAGYRDAVRSSATRTSQGIRRTPGARPRLLGRYRARTLAAFRLAAEWIAGSDRG